MSENNPSNASHQPAAPEEASAVDSMAAGVETPKIAHAASVEPAEKPSPEAPEVSLPDSKELEAWNQQVRRRMRQRTRRSLLGFGAAALAGFGAFEWLTSRREIDDVPWPFRKILEVNEQLARDYFSTSRTAPMLDPGQMGRDRLNGDLGLGRDFEISKWQLQVAGLAAQDEPLALGLDAIKKLPRMEMTTEFKCIEGWSVVFQWAGARFTDFMQAYPPKTQSGDDFSLDDPEDLPPYVSMSTPDGGYYVGLEMESMLHPQTLLCYEQDGKPLTLEHGAPLRLVIPVKYGVKNLKRIGAISYTSLRPADYWAEQGYDWYIGL
ncbi:MAG TPA: molybdopterin-dependent oxidoreductase [Terriglobia bacterium]